MIHISKKGSLVEEFPLPPKKEKVEKLVSKLDQETLNLCQAYDDYFQVYEQYVQNENTSEKFDGEEEKPQFDPIFKPSLYAHRLIKERLQEIQHENCVFCEESISRGGGDIEHFYPKAAYACLENGKIVLKYPGYFWLAYEWENLFLACTTCNQRLKRNFFPLQDPTQRFNPQIRDLSQEDSLLIHPSKQNPQDYLAYDGPELRAIQKNPYGNETIKLFQLNHPSLMEQRRRDLDIVKVYLKALELSKKHPQDQTLAQFAKEAEGNLIKYRGRSVRFAGMFQFFFRNKVRGR